jgi:ABC-type uncharacterized transport system involved in gliding motility auxiliary subunit
VSPALRRRASSAAGLAALLVTVLGASVVLDALLAGLELDLTERGLHTVSPDARALVADLDAPVTATLYFSRATAAGVPGLADHARRVEDLLRNLAEAADGRMTVETVDAAPFTDAEDAALAAGLQPVPARADGRSVLLGVVVRDDDGRRAVLPFAAPDRERFLEYELVRLVDELRREARPGVAIVGDLPLAGGFSPAGGRRAPWAILGQLRSRFEVVRPDLDGDDELGDADVLLLAHPRDLSAAARAAIDRAVLGGMPALVLVDPLAERDAALLDAPFPTRGTVVASDAGELLHAWGVERVPGRVLLDPRHALAVTVGDGEPVRHPAMPGFDGDALSASDVVTAGLAAVNVSSAGVLRPRPDARTTFEPLITSSAEARLVDAARVAEADDPGALADAGDAPGGPYVVAARVRGPARSAFPVRGEAPAEGEVELVVVADSDLLADALWVTVEDFFGRTLATPWAGNGDFVVNVVEHLAGDDRLVGLRTRAGARRPFERVEALRRRAEADYRARERELRAALDRLAVRLDTLVGDDGVGAPLPGPEQAAELARFRAEQRDLRRELREVQRRLGEDVAALGRRLALINVTAVPSAVVLLGLGVALWRRRRRSERVPASPRHEDPP